MYVSEITKLKKAPQLPIPSKKLTKKQAMKIKPAFKKPNARKYPKININVSTHYKNLQQLKIPNTYKHRLKLRQFQ